MSEAMKGSLSAGLALLPGETVYREDLTSLPAQGETMLRRFGFGTLAILFALVILALKGSEFVFGSADNGTYIALAFAGLFFLQGLWNLTRKPVSNSANTDGWFVSTSNRIAFVASGGECIEQVKIEDIGKVDIVDDAILIYHREDGVADPYIPIFVIRRIEDPDELFEFVRDTYT